MRTLAPVVCGLMLIACGWVSAVAEDSPYFAIRVVDEVSGRGVPLVELKTVNHLRFLTDSHGVAAIAEPDLLGQSVYFEIQSHGYEYPADGFGLRGKAIQLEQGREVTIKLKRKNLAQRLYRVTGSGIYRDSVLLGEPTPLKRPVLTAGVFGCDSTMAAIYRGKIFWFWGDTVRSHYPLGGNFHITGATSRLPEDGGMAPEIGVEPDYFLGPDGAIRPVAQMPGEGPTWISAVTVLPDGEGGEQMLAGYVKVRNHLESYRWGFARWNDETERFEHLKSFDRRPPIFLEPQTHTFLHESEGINYVYFANPVPLTRVPADTEAFIDPARYEGYTCLQAGTRAADRKFDRDAEGRLRHSWKANTPPLSRQEEADLVEQGLLKPEERLTTLRDPKTERTIELHTGSVYWNAYRNRWIMIAVELQGENSMLGDVWYAETANPTKHGPTGPWTNARRIVTHDNYTFYNPKHHPFFDQQDGRLIYFEGTYTHTFSGNPIATPRYDYNQIMYQLDLADLELKLPGQGRGE